MVTAAEEEQRKDAVSLFFNDTKGFNEGVTKDALLLFAERTRLIDGKLNMGDDIFMPLQVNHVLTKCIYSLIAFGESENKKLVKVLSSSLNIFAAG